MNPPTNPTAMANLNQEVKETIAELFQCDISELSDQTGPGDLPAWDSLGHVALMARIQDRFGKHVPVEDAIEVESIADLVAVIERLRNGE